MAETSFDGSELFARIARDLAEQADLRHTNQRIVELAAELTGCTVAALWALGSGEHPSLRACSDPQAGQELSRILHDIDEGPAHTALLSRHVALIADTEQETRFPRYLAALAEAGLPIRSALGYSLLIADRQLGAMLLYSAKPGYFTDEIIGISSVLADHAAIALDAATSVEKAAHMKQALQSNRRIGMAIGILMALHRLDEQRAFDLLRVASQHTHVKLRDVAEEVILTGAIPTWPVRRPD
ncbi:MAG TPA: GAF and ANTAR domain-containing protein [Jatrophihabitans sp.]|nr:GAF and ANTAR domain-containing protein [Jatrophihabitans sp.]